MQTIKDFIYLDMEKISSLYSQLTGGIIQTMESSSSSSDNNKNLRNYDFKIFKHEAGGTQASSSQLKETRVSHHEVYTQLEQELFKNGYTAEIGVDITKEDIQNEQATEVFEKILCVKAKGRIVLEDYTKIISIADKQNEIVNFINQSIVQNLETSSDFIQLSSQLNEQKKLSDSFKGNEKKQHHLKIKNMEKVIEQYLENHKISQVPTWIIDGMKKWINTFLPNIFTMRLYPFSDLNNFHIMSNLKKDSFVGNDIESIHYLFSSKPTIEVSLLGVITSIPKKMMMTSYLCKSLKIQNLYQMKVHLKMVSEVFFVDLMD